jgi:toxin ParE1/3/4
MTRIVLTPCAAADLDEIWDYTAERWSDEQAERYIRDIWNAIEAAAANPERMRTCDDVRPGYRKQLAGSHVIFFKVISGGIDVVRILHQRMDHDQHL